MLNPASPFVDLHRDMGVYRTEVGFYKNVRQAGLRVPRCYAAEIDLETQAFVLLLEDVGPGRGFESLDDAELAITNLASFHSQWWRNENLENQDWLGSLRGRCLKLIDAAEIPLAIVSTNPELRPLLDDGAGEALARLFAEPTSWADRWQRAPLTLCHGDYHPGQMFFPTDQNDFAVFDWQFALHGSGAVDLVFFLSTSLSQDQYRAHGRRLIEIYFNILSQAVPDYEDAQFQSDLGHASVFVLLARLVAFLSAGLDEAKAAHARRGVDWRERVTYPSLLASDLGGFAAVREALG